MRCRLCRSVDQSVFNIWPDFSSHPQTPIQVVVCLACGLVDYVVPEPESYRVEEPLAGEAAEAA